MSETSTLIACTGKITRAELARVPTPPATATHVPIPHLTLVEGLVDTLSRRHIGVVGEEFVVSKDGMEMFGVIDLETSFDGCRFAIGIRNANNKRFRLSCTVGLRVFVCYNLAFQGDYSPVLAKHSKNFSLEDSLSVGVDRMQRNFEPMRRQVGSWQAQQLSPAAAKLTIYQAFIEGDLEVPRHLARRVHELYFTPQHKESESRTMWSLSNAFTSAFKELDIQGARPNSTIPRYGEAWSLPGRDERSIITDVASHPTLRPSKEGRISLIEAGCFQCLLFGQDPQREVLFYLALTAIVTPA